MQCHTILKSGHILDLGEIATDPLLTVADIGWALDHSYRWNGHHPRGVTVGEHSAAMALWALSRTSDPLLPYACLWHDAEGIFTSDVPAPLKRLPHMSGFRQLAAHIREQLVARFAPSLGGFDWARVEPFDLAALAAEAAHFPGTDAHAWEDFQRQLPIPERFYTSARGLGWQVCEQALRPTKVPVTLIGSV